MDEIEQERDRNRERRIEEERLNQGVLLDCDCSDCRAGLAAIERQIDGELLIEAATASGEEIETYTCARCNWQIATAAEIASMIITASGDPYHANCSNLDSIICEDCGMDCGRRDYNYYQAQGGRPYCSNCFTNHYRYCANCSEIEDLATSNQWIAGGIEICSDCLKSIEICSDCGEIADQYFDGDPVCGYCSRERNRIEEIERNRAAIAAKIASGKCKKISLPAVITDQCLRQIKDLLLDAIETENGERIYPDFDKLIGGNEIVNKRGKIAKRIKNNCRREYQIALNSAVISEIGNLANNYSLPGGDHIIEITDDLDGTVGNFGDDNSCFQPGGMYRSNLLKMIDSGKFSALRIYGPDGEKIGRCWIFDGGDFTILFNAYGDRLNKWADLYSAAIGIEDREYIDLAGDMYINGSEGIVFGNKIGDRNGDYRIDSSPPPPGCDCENCGQFVHENSGIDFDHVTYCHNCYHDQFANCNRCDLAANREDLESLENELYCEVCIAEIGRNCGDCGDLFLSENGGGGRCQDCTNKRRIRAASILAAVIAGEDHSMVCGNCRPIALQRRQIGDQSWQNEIGDHCRSFWPDGCSRAAAGSGDPDQILFTNCGDCNASGIDHCEYHSTMIATAKNEIDQAINCGGDLPPILAAIASDQGI